MGNEFYYRDYDHHLGDVAKGTWRESRKLLPFLVEFVNHSMRDEWGGRSRPPGDHAFVLDDFLHDFADVTDDVYVTNGSELLRLFAWCDFLEDMDGAFALYKPLLEVMRRGTRGIEAMINDEDSQHEHVR